MSFRKILITGNAGSGKTTLSKHLSRLTGIEAYNLDRIVWQERWQKTPKQLREIQIAELIAKESWIIDGVSSQVLAKADLIVFLDASRATCYWRAMKRTFRHSIKQRPEMPANSPELLIVPQLIKIIWQFPRLVRPSILGERGRRNTQSFRHIRNQKDLSAFINSFTLEPKDQAIIRQPAA